jgi:hypothetical protein
MIQAYSSIPRPPIGFITTPPPTAALITRSSFSSRENFVIAIDYDSGNIKWILGDPTKHWYEFQSLR